MKRNRAVVAIATLVMCASALLVAAQDLPRALQNATSLPPAQRAVLQARAARLQAMPSEQRAQFEQWLADRHARSEPERLRLRAQWQAWLALPGDERAAVAAAAARFNALPIEQQIALRARFDALDHEDRHAWLLGPTLGAAFPSLQPLLGWVPEDEREPLLAMLRAMPPAQRDMLGVLAQRTPPQQRDALRRGLLATPLASRDTFLRTQLGR